MEIKGIIPAMATPMDANGAIDLKAIKPLVDKHIEEGAGGVFACGSMGEAASLSIEERVDIIKATVEAADGRVPVLGGTGFITTEDTIKATKMLEGTGVAAVSVITPCYWKLSQEAIYRHYASVINSTSLPVFVYNLPGNTGNNVDPETVGKLYKNEGLAGAKDSCAVWENTKGYMDVTGDDFTMLVGEDSLCLEGLKYGSKGSISAPSGAFTKVFISIYNRFKAGDIKGAEEAQADWGKICKLMVSIGQFPGNFKMVIDKTTSPVGPARLPVIPADADLFAKVLPELEAIAAKY